MNIYTNKYKQHRSPQIATFGFGEGNDKSLLIQNMILMVFKLLCL